MKDVIFIGNLSYNVNLYLNSFLVEGSSHNIIKKTKSLGNLLNVAIVLAKYNVNTYYFSTIGDDYEGKQIINNLHSNLINTDFVNVLNNTETQKNYIIRNEKNNSKTSLIQKNNIKYELTRKIEFYPSVIYTDSFNFEFARELKINFPSSKLLTTLDELNNNSINLAKISDYIIIPLKFAEILSQVKYDKTNKKSIIDLFMKTNRLFSAKIIIYDEEIGSLYQGETMLNIVPKLGDKNILRENSFDVYKSTFIYGIINNFNIDKIVKISTISKFLYDNNKPNYNIEEVIRIYEQNS